eukprot:8337624-Pyramimonas_sp.AAC.2
MATPRAVIFLANHFFVIEVKLGDRPNLLATNPGAPRARKRLHALRATFQPARAEGVELVSTMRPDLSTVGALWEVNLTTSSTSSRGRIEGQIPVTRQLVA